MAKQRVVIVTGGGSGIGRAVAHRFAEAGDKVYIVGRRLAKLKETAGSHKLLLPVVADLTDMQSVQQALQRITQEDAVIHVLVNCAGGNIKISPEATQPEIEAGWKQIIDTNLTSVFYMIHACLGQLASPGGRIINITSMAALAGSRQGGISGQAYSAAKSGIHGLTRTLVSDLAKKDITINCLAPGVIDDTEFFAGSSVPNELREAYLPRIPLGRLGEPDEIAAGVFYLASEEAGYITGEILNINGGTQFGR